MTWSARKPSSIVCLRHEDAVKLICTMGARAGSKGVPGKNTRLLHGLPLLAHSIRQAKACGLFDAVAFSSDSAEILALAKSLGADILVQRPPEMATDTAAKPPAIRHCFLEAEKQLGRRYEAFVDLDVTSPLRLPEDIVGAVKLFEETGASNVITAAPARRSPYFTLVELNDEGFVRLSKTLPQSIVRRQDSPRCWDLNGSIYVWRRHPFVDDPQVYYPGTRLYEMPEDRSIDIDSALDFAFVEFLMARRAATA
jgi:CMP-N,N'-diacetyllegionaminic acid synthase